MTVPDLLGPFVEAGVVDAAGLQLARAIARRVPGVADDVLLAAAIAVPAVRAGHACLELDHVHATLVADVDHDGALPWPDPGAWVSSLVSSDAVWVEDDPDAEPVGPLRPLVLWGRRLYLERYWRYERAVGADLTARASSASDSDSATDAGHRTGVLDGLFGPDDGAEPNRQRAAVRAALDGAFTVIAGGPGTGKTYTLARLLAAAQADGERLSVALCAPTGKAAARMTEAVRAAGAELSGSARERLMDVEATTIHRLLGRGDGVRFRHHRHNRLPHDLVVVDETSMVALPLMARLLEACRPQARLVMVGDPHQLASVEVGAVLGDIVAGATGHPVLADRVVTLDRSHRFGAGIGALADAVRAGDPAVVTAVLDDPDLADVRLVDPGDAAAFGAVADEVRAAARGVVEAARAGDAATGLDRAAQVKVLCATRYGPLGSHRWQERIESRLSALVPGASTSGRWYVGRPVIGTRNDYVAGVMNGDTGLVVRSDAGRIVAFPAAEGIRELAPAQLDAVETWWAMTIHRSQGSEFGHVVVSLPEAGSPALSRELLYTAITRGRERVTVVAEPAALAQAIAQPVARASGLRHRLSGR